MHRAGRCGADCPEGEARRRGTDQLALVSFSCCLRWWPARLRWPWCSPAISCGWRFIWCLSLGATAGLFFLAGADFVGSMQLLIYVGGTLVLLVFGVMLTAQGPFVSMKTSGGDWILSALVGGCAAGRAGADGVQDSANGRTAAERHSSNAAAGDADDDHRPQAAGRRRTRLGLGAVGRAGRSSLDSSRKPPLTGDDGGYLLPFEIVSVHLLVVLIGAAYLARTKRQKRASDQAALAGSSRV